MMQNPSFPMDQAQVQTQVSAFVRSVYNWMAIGLALTGFVAYYVAHNPVLLTIAIKGFILFAIGEIALVFFLSKIAPVGRWDDTDWPATLPLAREASERIIRVPKALLTRWQESMPTPLQNKESRDHWDYLYTLDDLSTLKGNRYHKKKNLVNQFIKKYDHTYLPFGPEMVTQALAMQTDWCTWRDCESHETLAAENRVIARVLDNYRKFDHITGGALRVDDKLVAYTVAEAMPDNTLLIHFEKGDPDYKGCYQAINQIFLKNDTGGHTLVNREQDLGNEGLRKAKLSYHPVDYVRKFEVTLI